MQVIGKARTGSFVLPGTYEIPGDRSTAAISLHQQRCEYVRAHQRRRATLGCQEAAVILDKDADLRFDCGASDQTGACFLCETLKLSSHHARLLQHMPCAAAHS